MANEKILNQKKEEVTKLANKIKESKIVLLTDYRGINVEDVTNLRTDLRKANSEYCVIKNNITRRALEEAGVEGLEDKSDEIVTLAKLPSKETLLSMLAGALLANVSKLAVALDQVRIQKENGSAETTEA